MSDQRFVVRLWDMFDGWLDVSEPLSLPEAHEVWLNRTDQGTRNTKYSDGDYYAVFDARTRMLYTPEALGR